MYYMNLSLILYRSLAILIPTQTGVATYFTDLGILPMFNFLFGKKKQAKTFSAGEQIGRLQKLSPSSALVSIRKPENEAESEPLGKAFFLRQDRKLYVQGRYLYITTPDNLKSNKSQLGKKTVILQFFSHSIPYKIHCRVLGRYRLPPNIVESLDFASKAAFKLVPISILRREEKRQFLRYTTKNYGNAQIPLTSHITFDLYLHKTNQEYPEEGAPPPLINDLETQPFTTGGNHNSFTTRDAITKFKQLMLQRPSFDRTVHVTKIMPSETRNQRQGMSEVLLGPTNVLALEMESLREVLYLKKSEKSTLRKDPNNPNNLQPGEKILARFSHEAQYYEMLCEVMEARTQNEVIRPLEFIRQERGIPLTVVNYSTGGCLIESSPDLLKYLMGPVYSETLAGQPDYSDQSWEGPLDFLRTPIVQLTFYPKLHFPEAVKRFEPELPFKICLGAQIIRSNISHTSGKPVLQHGLQFAYELQNTPLNDEDIVPWRYTRAIRDNEYFKRVHSNMSQLYGYIENHNLFKKNL